MILLGNRHCKNDKTSFLKTIENMLRSFSETAKIKWVVVPYFEWIPPPGGKFSKFCFWRSSKTNESVVSVPFSSTISKREVNFWPCVFIMSHTCCRVNMHLAVAWISMNFLLETCATSEVKVTATWFESATT